MAEAVANAFLNALVRRVAAGRSVDRISSVASFFLSRIDVLVDELLERKTDTDARALRGKIAVANAKLAYQSLKRIFAAERWEALRAKGARVQRLLWAGTGTKNPDYPDLMYVEPLIGPMTVNTVPEQTIAALLDHGNIIRGTLGELGRRAGSWVVLAGSASALSILRHDWNAKVCGNSSRHSIRRWCTSRENVGAWPPGHKCRGVRAEKPKAPVAQPRLPSVDSSSGVARLRRQR